MPVPKRTPGMYCVKLKVWTPYADGSKGHSSVEIDNSVVAKDVAELIQIIAIRSKFLSAEQEKIAELLVELKTNNQKERGSVMVSAYVIFNPKEEQQDYEQLLTEWMCWLSRRFNSVSFQTTFIRNAHGIGDTTKRIIEQMSCCEFAFIIANNDFRMPELAPSNGFKGEKIDLSFLGLTPPADRHETFLGKSFSMIDDLLLKYGRMAHKVHRMELRHGEE